MTDHKKLSYKRLLIFIGMGLTGVTGLILGITTITPSYKALIPLLKAANEGSINRYENRYISSSSQGSMNPTFLTDDLLLIDKLAYKDSLPQRGDIILFHPTKELATKGYKNPFIKRVVGLPEEIIEIKDGMIYINDESLEEDYIRKRPVYEHKTRQISKGYYFVLGDHPSNRYDSHYWEYVPEELIIGKVVSIYFPPSRAKRFD